MSSWSVVGGIVNTMKATRESDFDTLWDRGEERLDELFSMGVTTVEGKKWLWFGFANQN